MPLGIASANGWTIADVGGRVEENLYVGTSAAEILHFVSIPPEPSDNSPRPTFILASRLQPTYTQPSTTGQALPGVQQIVILSKVNKACVLCNGTLTFYTLPELSPAFNNTKVSNCSWVGGLDLNDGTGEENVEVIMICLKNRIRIVRVGEEPRPLKTIEYPGCLVSTRRDSFACVANAHSYALLDVDRQQKVSLFPISSLDEAAVDAAGGRVEDISSNAGAANDRSTSSAQLLPSDSADPRGHGRSTSLGTFVGALGRRQQSPGSRSRSRTGVEAPQPLGGAASPSQARSPLRSGSRTTSPGRRVGNLEKPLPAPPEETIAQGETPQAPPPQTSAKSLTPLKPHICSPTSTEFLLTTGTAPSEPGVGIFVNLEGDVVRGTLEFSRYPDAVVVDGGSTAATSVSNNLDENSDGYVLAIITRTGGAGVENAIEIQRWDVDAGEAKDWLVVSDGPSQDAPSQGEVAATVSGETPPTTKLGLRATGTSVPIPFPEVGDKLRSKRLVLPMEDLANVQASGERVPIVDQVNESHNTSGDRELKREKEEEEFARRLGGTTSHIVVWSGACIWWAVRNPLAMRLDAVIDQVLDPSSENVSRTTLDRSKIIGIVNSIRGQEARTETEFLSLGYIRQKLSLILFADLVINRSDRFNKSGADLRITEGLLMEGAVDPRLVLTMVPLLRREIVQGATGIWVHAGLVQVAQRYWSDLPGSSDADDESISTINGEVLSLIKRYLIAWRQRKGFGSIADEAEVFQTVDAALLHLLLHQDRESPRGGKSLSSTRAELYSVVDHSVDCFDRAVTLLEQHKRLYVLSRLYQSRKMAGNVLETWRRIIEGEPDDGGELTDGENEVRRYLVKIKDPTLVENYGIWLAKRHPALGVQVFTHDSSRVKIEPGQVVQLLKKRAPEAVKVYLEHLVFGKKNLQYANDLIAYYLDNVLKVLESSDQARSTLSQSYETYRALSPPKPTYRQFITDNAIPDTWWHDRLRLLELLGGSHGAGFSYDVPNVLSRIEPFEQDLVPESIILDGRQGRHQQALRLLTHGLGDYHTAINYCLLGGSSIFHPTSGPVPAESIPSREEQATLFRYLLSEFLRIDDISDRVERTSELLERFGGWFDVSTVLNLIPDSWSVELVSGFLVSAFRRLVHERSEAMIAKALSGAENLKISADLIDKCEGFGPQIEAGDQLQ